MDSQLPGAPALPTAEELTGALPGESQVNSEAGSIFNAARAQAKPRQAISTAGGTPPPPTAQDTETHLGQVYTPPETSTASTPPPPTEEDAAPPEGAKTTTAPPVKPKPRMTQEEIDASNKRAEKSPWDFVKDLVKGSVGEVATALPQIAAQAAHTATIGAGAVAGAADDVWDAFTGHRQQSYHTGAEDAVFDFDKNYVKPAIEHWTPKKGSFVGDEGSGVLAQGAGQAANMYAYQQMRAPGLALMMSNAFTMSATNNIDNGMDAKPALINATLDAVAAFAQMKLLGRDPASFAESFVPTALLRRAIQAVPIGDLINMGTDLTKKWLLEHTGNDKEAKKIDILGHLTNVEEAVTNAIFGAITKHGETEKQPPGAPPPPPPAAVKPPEPPAKAVPPPPPESATKAPAPTSKPEVAATPPVPDTPSAEPAKQIRAQLVDMNRKDTPRRGVLISPETQQHLDSMEADHPHAAPVKNQIEQARAQGRVVDTPAGTLIVKTKGDAAKAKGQLNAGQDPQVVIGLYTGAGDGGAKTPDMTRVVQGREPADGSITTEKAVKPEDVGPAQQAVIDQGKIPVVTTPEGVVAERHVGVTDEKAKSEEKLAEMVREHVEGGKAPAPEPAPEHVVADHEIANDDQHVTEVPHTELESMPSKEAAKPSAAPEPAEAPQEGFYKAPSGKEVPVHLAGPGAEGKIRVRPLNDEGEPGHEIEVPKESVRTGAEKAAEKAKAAEVEKENANLPKKGTALQQLPAAMVAHEKSEAAVPGRKNAADLRTRQDNASAFAGALDAAANEAAAKGTAPESSIQRAKDAAKKAIRLTLKSKEATDKGQGTSHAVVTARVREMHKAARELLGKTKPGEEPVETEKKALKPVKTEEEKTAEKTEKKAAKEAASKAERQALIDEENRKRGTVVEPAKDEFAEQREKLAKAIKNAHAENEAERQATEDRHAGAAEVGTERAERQRKEAASKDEYNDRLRDAGLTESEIRDMAKKPDAYKLKQIQEGYSWIEGSFRKITQDDVNAYKAAAVKEAAKKELERPKLEAAIKNDTLGRGHEVSSVLGSDWHGEGGSFEEQARNAFDRKYSQAATLAARYERVLKNATGIENIAGGVAQALEEKKKRAGIKPPKNEPLRNEQGEVTHVIDDEGIPTAVMTDRALKLWNEGTKRPTKTTDVPVESGAGERFIPLERAVEIVKTEVEAGRVGASPYQVQSKLGINQTEAAKVLKLAGHEWEPGGKKTGKPSSTPTEKPSKPGAAKVEAAGLKDTERFHELTRRYMRAEEGEAAEKARDDLERHILEVAEKLGQPREMAMQAIHHLMEMRGDRKQGTGRISDTIEGADLEEAPPGAVQEGENLIDKEQGITGVYRPLEGGKAAQMVWDRVTKQTYRALETAGQRLKESGFIDRMLKLQDSGKAVGYHEILRALDKVVGPELKAHVAELLRHAPDVPVFSRSDVVNPETGYMFGKHTAGLFNAMTRRVRGTNNDLPVPAMQILFNDSPGRSMASIVHTILHEGRHAATMYELHRNPTGELASGLNHALDILHKRLENMIGAEKVQQHIEFFKGQRPEEAVDGGVQWHLYGIQSIEEMDAELSNPKFVQELIDSEVFANPNENIPKPVGTPSLLTRVMSLISKMMGRSDPKLLLHLLDLTQRTAVAQRTDPRNSFMYPEGDAEHGKFGAPFERMKNSLMPAHVKLYAEPARVPLVGEEMLGHEVAARARARVEMNDLLEPAKPLKAEGGAAALIGREHVEEARENVHALASKSIDMARNAVTALKTVGQIFRDNVGRFGHDDDTNPINQLRDIIGTKNGLMRAMRTITNPVARRWMRLSNKDDLEVSQLMIDTTMYKLDPRLDYDKQPGAAKAYAGSEARHSEYQRRHEKLSDDARWVYDNATDANKRMRGIERRVAVDTALEGFGLNIDAGQKQLLYSAKDPKVFDRLIRDGGLVDVGDKNEKLRNALREWVGSEMEGPYHHLGRVGDYVVKATPEGTKTFQNREQAEAFAKTTSEASPNAKAKVEQVGGKWTVDYKIDHVSMHQTRREAEKAREALEKQGIDVQNITQKAYDRETAGALSSGMRELMTEATQRINRSGKDAGTQALVDSLHTAFMQMQAQRSAYAGSRLIRNNVGGVKAKDMRQNFASHSSGSIWHAAQLRTMFKQATAMARLREMAKDSSVPQALTYKRGEVVSALGKHAADEVASFGKNNPTNAMFAKLGFLSYLTSPAHAAIWLTQNFTTGIPWAGARYGYGDTTVAFAKGMAAVTGPAFRQAMHEVFSRNGSADEIHDAVTRAVAAHPTMGKWAGAIKELGERGVISHGYANELSELARGSAPSTTRVMEWARMLPAMADAINRTSTALAGLELTGGDLRKTSDMVEAIHADYSGQNKPLAFKAIRRYTGLSSITMFKTYAQEMAHLTYSNLVASIRGPTKQAKWEGAKTVAGLALMNTMFAGVYGAVALEPIRFALYAYHKLFDDEGEVWDMKNAIHHFLIDHLGAGAGNVLAQGPIAAALGVDVQDRMGLANLFFHNPPDLLTTDKDAWKDFISDEAGPIIQLLGNSVMGAVGHIQNGEYLKAVLSTIPVKMLQDGLKGLELMNEGKKTAAGSHITAPSGLDAFKQTFGLKPESVAEAQEKRGVKSEYSRVQGMVRGSIIRQILESKEGSPELEKALDRLKGFNDRNPGAGISQRDIQAQAAKNAKTEADVPTKNERAEQAADFSGS